MSFKKPFRATPVKLGLHYRRKEARVFWKTAISYLLIGGTAGACLGIGSVALTSGGIAKLLASVRPLAVAAGVARSRPPQAGDYWPGCNVARAAGTAPIYADEPGYRVEMDGDGDGIACEPYRGI